MRFTKKKKNGNIAAFMTVDHRGRRAAGRRPNKTNPNAGRKKVKQVDKVTRNLAAAASPASTPEAKKAKVKRSGATKDPKWAANMELVTTCYKSKLGDCYNRGMSQTTYLKAVEDKYNIKPSTLTPRSWLLPRTSSGCSTAADASVLSSFALHGDGSMSNGDLFSHMCQFRNRRQGENWLDGGDTSTLSNLKWEGGKEGKWVSSGTPGAFPVVADKFDLQSS